MQKTMNINDIAIVYIKGNYYIIHFWYMIKYDAINTMKNCDLSKKTGLLYFFYIR